MTLPSSVTSALKFWNGNTVTWSWDIREPHALFGYEESAIKSAITNLYQDSKTFHGWIDEYISNGGLLRFSKNTSVSVALADTLNGDSIIVDTDEFDNAYYINSKGILVKATAELILAHEIVHAFHAGNPQDPSGTDSEQNAEGWDFQGDAVRWQNKIADEMGLDNLKRASYSATIMDDDVRFGMGITTNKSYSNNEEIDIARFGSLADDNMDHTARLDNSSDLIFGFVGKDTIRGGGGRDFIYGGDGEDNIFGGDGNDVLCGGGDKDSFVGGGGNDTIWGGDDGEHRGLSDGKDVVDYSEESNGISIHFKRNGDISYLAVVDMRGDTDTLYSIEEVIGTTKRDMIYIEGEIPANLNLTIDARGGQGQPADAKATINAENHPNGSAGINVVINVDGTGQIIDKGTTGSIDLIGYQTQIIGSQGDDSITDESEGDKRIDGNAGDDEITVTQGAAEIYGGDGDDTIAGGNGNDLIVGGAGLDNILSGGAGNDLIISNGWDTVDGGEGDDYLLAQLTSPNPDVPPDPVSLIVEFDGGEGNDVLDVRQAYYAKVLFDEDGGHDKLLSNNIAPVNVGHADYWKPQWEPADRHAQWGNVEIDMSSVGRYDVTFVWDAELLYYGEGHGDSSAIYEFCGNLAIRINSTGATIHIGLVYGQANGPNTGNPADIWQESISLEMPTVMFSDYTFSTYTWDQVNAPIDVIFSSVDSYDVAEADFADGADPGSNDDGTSGNDNLSGGVGSDTVSAGDGDDSIAASAGSDTIDGGNGTDTVDFFNGYKSYRFARDGADLVVTDLRHGGQTTLTNVEEAYFLADNVTLSVTAIAGTIGTSGNDTLTATTMPDIIDGGDGADVATWSGNSNDYLIYRDDLGRVTVKDRTASDNIDTLLNVETLSFLGDAKTFATSTVPAAGTNGVDMIVGTSLADYIAALDDDDDLSGDDGNDVIDGGAGADQMDGGDGDDTFYVDDEYDAVIEASNEGNDTVISMAGYTLPTNVENLWLLANVEGFGNDLDNVMRLDSLLAGGYWGEGGSLFGLEGEDLLVGSAFNDVLDGGDGDDTFIASDGYDQIFGGDGSDTVQLSGALDSYRIGWQPDGTISVESVEDFSLYTVMDDVEAFEFVDEITLSPIDLPDLGTSGKDTITGTDRNDIIFGLEDDDTLDGGKGSDYLSGGDGDDVLNGGDGADTLEGGAGANTLNGGEGDDIYYIGDTDTVVELSDEGTDTVYTYGSYTLTANVERLFSEDYGDITATGNASNNEIHTLSGNDTLFGLDGDDALHGGTGDDELDGGDGDDTVFYEGSSIDFTMDLQLDGSVIVTDTNDQDSLGFEGEDTLIDIEFIYFAGDNVTITVAELV